MKKRIKSYVLNIQIEMLSKQLKLRSLAFRDKTRAGGVLLRSP